MGWTFGWDSKRELIEHLTESITERYDILRSSTVGGNFWFAAENKETKERSIGLCLLKGDRVRGYNGPQWGYKDLSESMGPCEVNCPLAMLDLVPDPGWRWEDSEPWRDRVRAYHDRRKRLRNMTFTLGQTVRLVEGCKPAEITVASVKPLRGYGPDGRLYRVRPRHIAEGAAQA